MEGESLTFDGSNLKSLFLFVWLLAMASLGMAQTRKDELTQHVLVDAKF